MDLNILIAPEKRSKKKFVRQPSSEELARARSDERRHETLVRKSELRSSHPPQETGGAVEKRLGDKLPRGGNEKRAATVFFIRKGGGRGVEMKGSASSKHAENGGLKRQILLEGQHRQRIAIINWRAAFKAKERKRRRRILGSNFLKSQISL